MDETITRMETAPSTSSISRKNQQDSLTHLNHRSCRVDVPRVLCQVRSLNGCFSFKDSRIAMSALKIAEHHLNEALSRLEQVMARRLAAADPDQAAVIHRLTGERDALQHDVDGLRAECERLGEALKMMEREHDDMKTATGQVASRLDSSIDELDRMIGD